MNNRAIMNLLNLLTLLSTTLTVAQSAVFFDPIAPVLSCINPDGTPFNTPGEPVHLTNINTTAEEQIILLKPIKPTTTIVGGSGDGITSMCVFHRWTLPLEDKEARRGYYIPLGRSVPSIPGEFTTDDGTPGENGDWTRPPGIASRQLSYICGTAGNNGNNFNSGEYLCEVTLPMSSQPHPKDPSLIVYKELPYFLTYYQRSTSVRNEISRFLQKNTFGPTVDELDTMETTFNELQSTGMTHSDAMAQLQLQWVQNQMDPTTFTSGEFSSLRKYWRRRLNPRAEETYRIGESGPHPCERNSKWRKFAFTNYDVQKSKALRWGTQDLGGSFQTQQGHRITVETVQYFGPPGTGTGNSSLIESTGTSSPTVGVAASSPSSSPVAIPVATFAPVSSQSAVCFFFSDFDHMYMLNFFNLYNLSILLK